MHGQKYIKKPRSFKLHNRFQQPLVEKMIWIQYLKPESIFHKTSIWFKRWSKVKCTLVQALRLCTGRKAHRGSRGVSLPFHDHRNRRGWGVNIYNRPPPVLILSQTNPVYASSHFLKIHNNIILPSMPRSSKCFFPSGFSTKLSIHLYCLPYVPHAPPISFFLIWSPE